MSLYPLIAIVTDHTDKRRNEILAQLLNKLHENLEYRKILSEYWFVFTGGTYSRIFEGIEGTPSLLKDSVKDFFLERRPLNGVRKVLRITRNRVRHTY